MIRFGGTAEEAALLSDLVARRYGCIPEMIPGDANEVGVLVFIPVSLEIGNRSVPSPALTDELRGIPYDAHDGVVFVFGGYRPAHHPAEHDRRRFAPALVVSHGVEEVREIIEQAFLLLSVGRLALGRYMLRLEHLVKHHAHGVGEVHDGIFVPRGDGYQDVAAVQLGLEEAVVLPAEDQRDLLPVCAGALGELPHRDGDAGVVAVPLGDGPAGAHDEEAVPHGVVHGRADDRVLQDGAPVLGPVEGGLPYLAGVHEVQFLHVEVGAATGYGTYVALELGGYHHDADIRHVIGGSNTGSYLNYGGRGQAGAVRRHRTARSRFG